MYPNPVPATLTITLQPAGSYLPSNGTYTIQPLTLLPLYAVVTDQNGVVQPGKQVSLTVNVSDGSGGHIHTDNRSQGILSCSTGGPGTSNTCTLTTDSSGSVPFTFIATPVSGSHTITAACTNCTTPATVPVNVKVDNLIPIPVSPQLYALTNSTGTVIGAIPGQHTDNHYLTATAIGRLKTLAILYTTSVNPNAVLYLNDASLVWGGLFDVDISTPWLTPHSLHDTGVSLDIRAANSGPNNEGAVPATLFMTFIKEAKKKNINAALHCQGYNNTDICMNIARYRHIHVDF